MVFKKALQEYMKVMEAEVTRALDVFSRMETERNCPGPFSRHCRAGTAGLRLSIAARNWNARHGL